MRLGVHIFLDLASKKVSCSCMQCYNICWTGVPTYIAYPGLALLCIRHMHLQPVHSALHFNKMPPKEGPKQYLKLTFPGNTSTTCQL